MKLIVGLGNPGVLYEKTRHNVGFLAVQEIVRSLSGDQEWRDVKPYGKLAEISLCNERFFFLLPQTYMNLSGEAVVPFLKYHNMNATTDLLVFSDDIDMEFGKVRFRSTGSSGGQNGLKNIISLLGHQDFARIKIGIGRHEHMSTADWVLSKFSQDEITTLKDIVFPAVKKIIPWKEITEQLG